jgi:hypothetical protein
LKGIAVGHKESAILSPKYVFLPNTQYHTHIDRLFITLKYSFSKYCVFIGVDLTGLDLSVICEVINAGRGTAMRILENGLPSLELIMELVAVESLKEVQ